MTHELTRKHSGEGIQQTMTPTCSCGWVGRGYAAYNSYQFSNVSEQEEAHINSSRRLKNES